MTLAKLDESKQESDVIWYKNSWLFIIRCNDIMVLVKALLWYRILKLGIRKVATEGKHAK